MKTPASTNETITWNFTSVKLSLKIVCISAIIPRNAKHLHTLRSTLNSVFYYLLDKFYFAYVSLDLLVLRSKYTQSHIDRDTQKDTNRQSHTNTDTQKDTYTHTRTDKLIFF